jgi:nitric oxide reductase
MDFFWLYLTMAQIIYTILGVPFHDLQYLTQQNAIRTNGSSTAREASSANQ